MKKLFTVGLVGITAIMLAACNDGGEATTNAETTTEEVQTVKKPALPTVRGFQVGDIANLDQFEITLNSAERKSAGEYDYLETEGNEFLVVDLTVENKGQEPVDPSFVLTVKDDEGNVVSNTYSTHESSQWADATINQLAAGDFFKAQTSFEIAPEAKDLQFTIQYAMINQAVIFNIE